MLRLFISILFLSVLLCPASSIGDPSNNLNDVEEKFQPGEMIMHHILDTHDWHILDWQGHAVSIPLPIIIFHEDTGWEIFLSSKFNHGHDVYNGYKLDHGNIIAVNADGSKNIKETDKIWDLSITKNVFSLLLSIVILLSVFISISNRYKKNKNKAPKGIQSLLEPIIIFVRDDIAKSAIGDKDYKRYLPFLLTVFFFIFLNNLLGLVPFFPGGANLTGNIAVPMVLAAMVFIITTLSGKKYYWKHIFAMPGVPKPVLLILTPIEIFGVFLKPLVLMIRLFANITAGHIIILSFFSMIFIFGEMSPIAGYGVSVFSGLFVLFMMTLELLVAFLQAYVFTLLAAMYFGMAVEEH
ncbi:MAG: ATP synthase F0 subunit A [Flavobacteriales bacterium]|nr:ATP synthase F0 subunit A [Flavobacteriales bacterium]